MFRRKVSGLQAFGGSGAGAQQGLFNYFFFFAAIGALAGFRGDGNGRGLGGLSLGRGFCLTARGLGLLRLGVFHQFGVIGINSSD